MNTWFLVSGVLALSVLIGHCTLGERQFYRPMLAADFDPLAKRMMSFVWHLSTLAVALPPIALLWAGWTGNAALAPAVAYVVVQFAAMGAIHLAVITTSGIPAAIYKLFQWALFFAVAGTAWAGL